MTVHKKREIPAIEGIHILSKAQMNIFKTQELHVTKSTVFKTSKCKSTNIFKEPETTTEVFPEVEVPETFVEIPEHPQAEGIILYLQKSKVENASDFV